MYSQLLDAITSLTTLTSIAMLTMLDAIVVRISLLKITSTQILVLFTQAHKQCIPSIKTVYTMYTRFLFHYLCIIIIFLIFRCCITVALLLIIFCVYYT